MKRRMRRAVKAAAAGDFEFHLRPLPLDFTSPRVTTHTHTVSPLSVLLPEREKRRNQQKSVEILPGPRGLAAGASRAEKERGKDEREQKISTLKAMARILGGNYPTRGKVFGPLK